MRKLSGCRSRTRWTAYLLLTSYLISFSIFASASGLPDPEPREPSHPKFLNVLQPHGLEELATRVKFVLQLEPDDLRNLVDLIYQFKNTYQKHQSIFEKCLYDLSYWGREPEFLPPDWALSQKSINKALEALKAVPLTSADQIRWQHAQEKLRSFYQKYETASKENRPSIIVTSDLWPHEFYRLPQSLGQTLLQKWNQSQGASHKGCPIERDDQGIYLKVAGLQNMQSALNPDKEYMVQELYQILGFEVPCTGTLYFQGVLAKQTDGQKINKSYALQVAPLIYGQTLTSFTDNIESLQLQNYAQQLIGALLTRPEDGNLDNFIVTSPSQSRSIISIDNDQVFIPLLEKKFIKSALLVLAWQHFDINPLLKEEIKKWDVEKIVYEWLLRLQARQKRFTSFKESTLQVARTLCCLTGPTSEGIPKLQTTVEDKFKEVFNLTDPLIDKDPAMLSIYKTPPRSFYSLSRLDVKWLKDQLLILKAKMYDDEVHNPIELWQALDEESYQYYKDIKEHLQTNQGQQFSYTNFLGEAFNKSDLISNKQALEKKYEAAVQKRLLNFATKKADSKNQAIETLLNDFLGTCTPWHYVLSKLGLSSTQPLMVLNADQITALSSFWQGVFRNSILQANHFLSTPAYGRSRVCAYPPDEPYLYVKLYPEFPAYEYAARQMMRQLNIRGIPQGFMLALQSNPPLPLLISQAIQGQPVVEVWKDDQVFNNLDLEHTQRLILAALLMQVEDGKEDNYILTPDRKYLIPIDNDHAFLPAIQNQGHHVTVAPLLLTKSLLFCLPQMHQRLVPALEQELKQLEPVAWIGKWLKDLQIYQDIFQRHQLSFELKEVHPVKPSNPGHTVVGFPLSADYLKMLYIKLVQIQDILNTRPGDVTSHLLLEACEPLVYRWYEQAHRQHKGVREQFLHVTKKLYPPSPKGGPRASAMNSHKMIEYIVPDRDFNKMPKIHQALNLIQGFPLQREALQRQYNAQAGQVRGFSLFGRDEEEKQELAQQITAIPQTQSLNLEKFSKLSMASFLVKLQEHPIYLVKYLNLARIPGLGQESLNLLMATCLYLEHLDISGWVGDGVERGAIFGYNTQGKQKLEMLHIHEVEDIHKIERFQALPALKRLKVNGCPFLNTVNIQLPGLQIAEFKDNKLLNQLNIMAPILSTLHIENSSLITESDLKTIYWNKAVTKDETIEVSSLKIYKDNGSASVYSDKSLRLNGNSLEAGSKSLSAHGIQKIIALSTRMGRSLTHLNIGYNDLATEGAQALAPLTNLTDLDIRNNRLSDGGAQALAHLINLTDLSIWNNNLTAEGAQALAPLTKLTTLYISSNNLTDKGAQALAHLTRLTSLSIGENKLTDTMKASLKNKISFVY